MAGIAISDVAMPQTGRDVGLSRAVIAAYSLPSLGIGTMVGLVMIYYLKFATDVLLIAPAILGAVFGAARMWDAISDPIAGHWSDRTRHALGRRRPWLFASALLIPGGFVAIWVPPAGISELALVSWFAIWLFFLHTALTVFAIPHQALGAELSPRSHDRTRAFAASSFVAHIGGVVAIGCVAVLERADDPRSVVLPIATTLALATSVLIAVGTWWTPEAPEHLGRGSVSLRHAFRDIFGDPFARAIIGARFVQQVGLASTLSLLPFVSDYVLRTPGWTAFYLASAVTGLLGAIPVWVYLARRFDKVACWRASVITNLLLYAGFATCSEGDGAWVLGGIFFAGAAGACSGVVAPSLLADVIDKDERRTGERKEGAYFAAWTFADKSALGVKFVIIGVMLQLCGFEPNVVQTDTALYGLRFAVAGIPCMGMLVVLWLLARVSRL